MSDSELLARLIQCEAGGEGDDGMKAVATVVLNRVRIKYGEYSRYNSIDAVIKQMGQFVCARTELGGVYNSQNLYNMNINALSYDIANWAIAGNKLGNVAYSLWFYAPYSANCREEFPNTSGAFAIKIGNHCFYNPTPAYSKT